MPDFLISQMVNVGFGSGFFLALIHISFGIYYGFASIVSGRKYFGNSTDTSKILEYLIQVSLIALFFIGSGLILFFNGWRLDPILMFCQVMTTIFCIILALQDKRTRQIALSRKNQD